MEGFLNNLSRFNSSLLNLLFLIFSIKKAFCFRKPLRYCIFNGFTAKIFLLYSHSICPLILFCINGIKSRFLLLDLASLSSLFLFIRFFCKHESILSFYKIQLNLYPIREIIIMLFNYFSYVLI